MNNINSEGLTAIATVITAIFAALIAIAGAISWACNQYKRKKRDKILTEISKFREKGTAVRNRGLEKNLEGDAFKDWSTEMSNIDDDIVAKVKELSPVEGGFLDTRGEIPLNILPVHHVTNPEQLKILRNATFTMKEAKRIADKHHPPRNYD